jgi:hypothetical protein
VPSEPEVVYTTQTRRAVPPPINRTAALSDPPSDNKVVYTTDMPHTSPPHTPTLGPGTTASSQPSSWVISSSRESCESIHSFENGY